MVNNHVMRCFSHPRPASSSRLACHGCDVLIHLPQLAGHLRAARPEGVTRMVHAQVVCNHQVPRRRVCKLRQEVLRTAVQQGTRHGVWLSAEVHRCGRNNAGDTHVHEGDERPADLWWAAQRSTAPDWEKTIVLFWTSLGAVAERGGGPSNKGHLMTPELSWIPSSFALYHCGM